MIEGFYQPIFEIKRGKTVESIHYGSIAVVDSSANLIARFGNPDVITFLRSSAKPIQALPLLQHGGKSFFGLSQQEIAIMCASHSATDEHLEVLKQLQSKIGVTEKELLCGIHPPFDKPTAEKMRDLGIPPSPNHHNCSGKHTGMLAFAQLLSQSKRSLIDELRYVDIDHPVQKEILQTMGQMSGLTVEQIELGVDGCSAPNFAMPLRNAALAFARLCDPEVGRGEPPLLSFACTEVVKAMTSHPNLVAGPGRFDTRLMQAGNERMISKSGAEGYQMVGLLPDAIKPGSPAIGIAVKISDGDQRGIAKSAVALEVLRQLTAFSEEELAGLGEFGPSLPIENWRKIVVGEAKPTFSLM